MCNDTFEAVKKKAASLLESVLKHQISPEEARLKWPKHEDEKKLNAAFHILFHFEDDADIRAKDKKYSDWQIAEIEKLINELQAQQSSSCWIAENRLISVDSGIN